MSATKILADYWPKPIPTSRFDWTAVTDGYEPGQPVGYGRTREEAIADLRQQLDEMDGWEDFPPDEEDGQ